MKKTGHLKNRKINIYISPRCKKFLDATKSKYHVSYSTIIETLVMTAKANVIMTIKDTYIVKEHTKTSVRPRTTNTLSGLTDSEISKIYTNLCEIFSDEKLLKEYCETWEIDKAKFRCKIGNELAKKRETYWDYNSMVRNQARAIRQNKEYWRKILEQ